MNNISFPESKQAKKEEEKPKQQKKNVSYKEEISVLEKVKNKLQEKYKLRAINTVSNSILEIESCIQSLKKMEYYEN